MRVLARYPTLKIGIILLGLAGLAVFLNAPSFTAADSLPGALSDDGFWHMVSDFSEEGGSFRFEYMSNERGFQSVIPDLKKTTKPGGVYLGVGPEQNFTYINAVQPKIAFIFDIRRQNMIEHLMYKAIFEMSPNRAAFVSRLFSRKMPAGLDDKATATALFRAYETAKPDEELFAQNLQSIKDHLIKDHHFQLNSEDQADLDFIYKVFFDVGPGPNRWGGGFGGYRRTGYSDLMAATDDEGKSWSYLATEENFQRLREMQRKNLIVPVVGNFAGSKALRAVASYVKDHNAIVAAFYTSNVEQYLFQQDQDWRLFFSNVSRFPMDASSTFIRSSHFSYTPDGRQISRRLVRGNFISLLCPMAELIEAFNAGRILGYEHVIHMSR